MGHFGGDKDGTITSPLLSFSLSIIYGVLIITIIFIVIWDSRRREKTKLVFKYGLMLSFGILLAVLTAEIILRIYNPFAFRTRGNKIILDKNSVHVMKGHSMDRLDEEIIQRRNSLGFRGEEPPIVFNRYLTIITVGGSTTECFYLSEGKTWSDQLSVLLKEQFAQIWVNNAGLDGHSTYAHLVLMQDYISKIQPDMVLFLIGNNDKGLNVPKSFDQRIMEGGANRENAKPALCWSSVKCFHSSLTDCIIYYSEFANLVVNLSRYFKTIGVLKGQTDIIHVLTGKLGHKQIDLTGSQHRVLENHVMKQVLDEHSLRYLPGYEERVKALVKISRKNAIEPVLITQPSLYGAGVDDVTGVNLETIQMGKASNGLLEWKILELYNDAVRRIGKKEDVLVIDLARKMPKSSLYYYDMLHYTNEGAYKIAEIVFEGLFPYMNKKWVDYRNK